MATTVWTLRGTGAMVMAFLLAASQRLVRSKLNRRVLVFPGPRNRAPSNNSPGICSRDKE